MFEKLKTLGVYSSNVGHAIRSNVKVNEYYLVVPVGKAFHTFNCSKLGICRRSDQHPDDITCIAASDLFVFTGCQNVVRAFTDNRKVKYKYLCDDDVKLILPFHSHVVVVDVNSKVQVFHVDSGEIFAEINFDSEQFQVTAAIQPQTYVNKVLFGSHQGKLQLWNIRKNRMLYEFSDLGNCPITALEQSPAVDVIGVGFDSGLITLLNLRSGVVIMKLHQEYGAVTSMSFMTNGLPILVTGSPTGEIVVWNLDKQLVDNVMHNAHSGVVHALSFLLNQMLLVSNSSDNSIKMWVFEKSNFSGRLLRERSGHSGNISKLKFYDDDTILSAGFDSTVRRFSCVHERHNKNFGTAVASKKSNTGVYPPIENFTFEKCREREWDGMISFYKKHKVASSWSIRNCKMGEHNFVHKRFLSKSNGSKLQTAYVTCVNLTSCGNFCLIGYNSGHVDRYNIQSGIFRGSYSSSLNQTKSPVGNDDSAHSNAVKAICTDSLNQVAVTVGQDKTLKLWSFSSFKMVNQISLDHYPSFACFHSATSMLAIVLEDFSVVILDIESFKVVRKLLGHVGCINDACWSEDGHMIVTASNDCSVRFWDVSLDRMISSFVATTAVKTLTLSPNSALLATSHVGSSSITLWYNSSLYDMVTLHSKPTNKRIDLIDSDSESSDESDMECENDVENLLDQLDIGLYTQSTLPSSRWAHLLKLDVIRQRNKPKQPPKKAEAAPFFLTALSSSTALPETSTAEKEETTEKINPFLSSALPSKLSLALSKGYTDTINCMEKMGPSSIENSIRSLQPELGGSIDDMKMFLKFIVEGMQAKLNFELMHAYLSLFLKIHTDLLIESYDQFQEIMQDVVTTQTLVKDEMCNLLDESVCYVNFTKSSLL